NVRRCNPPLVNKKKILWPSGESAKSLTPDAMSDPCSIQTCWLPSSQTMLLPSSSYLTQPTELGQRSVFCHPLNVRRCNPPLVNQKKILWPSGESAKSLTPGAMSDPCSIQTWWLPSSQTILLPSSSYLTQPTELGQRSVFFHPSNVRRCNPP